MRIRRNRPDTADSWEEELACDCGALVTVVEGDLATEHFYYKGDVPPPSTGSNAGRRRRAYAVCVVCGDKLICRVPRAVIRRLNLDSSP